MISNDGARTFRRLVISSTCCFVDQSVVHFKKDLPDPNLANLPLSNVLSSLPLTSIKYVSGRGNNSWQNCKLTKWWVVKMASWKNGESTKGELTKWRVDKMASWQNGKSTKWRVDKKVSWQNGELTKWQVDKMVSQQNGKSTKWQVFKMESRQNGKSTKLRVDKIASQENG
jgi:hypothetical protein